MTLPALVVLGAVLITATWFRTSPREITRGELTTLIQQKQITGGKQQRTPSAPAVGLDRRLVDSNVSDFADFTD